MSAIGMPSHLLAFFAPRPPLERLPVRGRRERRPFDGLAALLGEFERETPPPPTPFISPQERRRATKLAREKEHQEIQTRRRALYDPTVDPEKQKTSDPRRTLFVGRLSYETTEKKLLKTFEAFGPIRDIRVVADAESKPRGYAFIEFKTEDGMWNAYKNANQKVIDGRTVLVDTERGRQVPGWFPRRLGGGEGPPRKGVPPARLRIVNTVDAPPGGRFSRGGGGGSRGYSRGGYRGGGGVGARPPPRYGSGGRGGGPYMRRGQYENRYDQPDRDSFADHRSGGDHSSRYYH